MATSVFGRARLRAHRDVTDTVWAVRHGERKDTTTDDWEAVAERVHDPPLTELGRWAAWRVGRRFAESPIEFDAVYASPFTRTVETAAEICREIDATFRLEPGLSEHRNADWFDAEPETLPRAELAARFDTLQLDHEPLVEPGFPERHAEASARVGETTRQIVAQESGPVLLVGHGLTIGGVVDGLVGSTAGVEAPLCGLTRVERDATDHRDDDGGTDRRDNGVDIDRRDDGGGTDERDDSGDADDRDGTDGGWRLDFSGDTDHL